MSYSIAFSTGETFFLCSTSAWTAFVDHVETLTGYAKLQEFCEDGQVEDTLALASELLDLQELDPPEDTVLLASLIEHIGVGDPGETIVLTQGEDFEDA